MARTRTLSDLIADVRLRADNQALTDPQITEFINQSISDLYDQLMSAFGADYFEKDASPALATVANVATTALPADFLKLTGLWWNDSGTMRRIERAPNVEATDDTSGWDVFHAPTYRIQSAAIRWYPKPTAAHALVFRYIPAAVRLVDTSQTFDGYNGWEEWVVLDAAMKCLEREGNTEDAGLLATRKARIEARVAAMAERDQSEPERVGDVYTGYPLMPRRQYL